MCVTGPVGAVATTTSTFGRQTLGRQPCRCGGDRLSSVAQNPKRCSTVTAISRPLMDRRRSFMFGMILPGNNAMGARLRCGKSRFSGPTGFRPSVARPHGKRIDLDEPDGPGRFLQGQAGETAAVTVQFECGQLNRRDALRSSRLCGFLSGDPYCIDGLAARTIAVLVEQRFRGFRDHQKIAFRKFFLQILPRGRLRQEHWAASK